MPPTTTTRRPARVTLSAAVLALVLASCSATADTGSNQPGSPAETATGEGLPSEHVHGVAFNPADDKVYLATHTASFVTTRAARSGSAP